MTTLTARVAALVAVAATALFVSGCTSPASDGHTDHEHGPGSSAAADATFNDADVAFANDMIPHHEQAVELSKLVPSRSSDPAVIELAAAISKAQEPEIAIMRAFLAQWSGGDDGSGGSGASSHDGHDMGASGMEGMVDSATMARLETLKGADFDTLWLQSMISHHEGAIAMAKTEIADGADAGAKRLAQQIVDAQQSEIEQMKSMVGA